MDLRFSNERVNKKSCKLCLHDASKHNSARFFATKSCVNIAMKQLSDGNESFEITRKSSFHR